MIWVPYKREAILGRIEHKKCRILTHKYFALDFTLTQFCVIVVLEVHDNEQDNSPQRNIDC